MRFFHKEDSSGIVGYAKLTGLRVTKCSSSGSHGSVDVDVDVDVDEITQMMSRSQTLWGGTLSYYLRVGERIQETAVPLMEAIEIEEGSHGGISFLIVGYQDGGLITISNQRLDFQMNADEAGWWRPAEPRLRLFSAFLGFFSRRK